MTYQQKVSDHVQKHDNGAENSVSYKDLLLIPVLSCLLYIINKIKLTLDKTMIHSTIYKEFRSLIRDCFAVHNSLGYDTNAKVEEL